MKLNQHILPLLVLCTLLPGNAAEPAPDFDFIALDTAAAPRLLRCLLQNHPTGEAVLNLWVRGDTVGQGWLQEADHPAYAVPVMAHAGGFFNLPSDTGCRIQGGALQGIVYRGSSRRYRLELNLAKTIAGKWTLEEAKDGAWSVIASGRAMGESLNRQAADGDQGFAAGAAYPCWMNQGAGVGSESGCDLIRDPSKARVVWKSEELIPPPYHEGINLGVRPLSIQSGHASPVFADGHLYLHYFVGDGLDPLQDKIEKEKALKAEKGHAYEYANFPDSMLHKKFCPVAHQIVVAIDATTGATRWKTVFASDGPNITGVGRTGVISPSSKAASHLTPCVAYGMVYAKGTGNVLYALDAKSGKLVWKAGSYDKNSKTSTHTDTVQFAGGIIATCHGYDKRARTAELVGYDAKTGQERWRTACNVNRKGTTAIRWVHKGREFFLTPNGLIDPANGKFLWELPKDEAFGHSIVIADETWLVQRARPPRIYQISPQACKQVGTFPQDYNWERELYGTIYRGQFYHRHTSFEDPVGSHWQTSCIDLSTGKLAAQPTWGRYSFASVTAGDGLIFNSIGCGAFPLIADPAAFTEVEPSCGGRMQVCADVQRPVIYQTSPECSAFYADGRLFTRTFDGLLCYDLRQK